MSFFIRSTKRSERQRRLRLQFANKKRCLVRSTFQAQDRVAFVFRHTTCPPNKKIIHQTKSKAILLGELTL